MNEYVNLDWELRSFIEKNQPIRNKAIMEEFMNRNFTKSTISRKLKKMVKGNYLIHPKPHSPYIINAYKHPNKEKENEIQLNTKNWNKWLDKYTDDNIFLFTALQQGVKARLTSKNEDVYFSDKTNKYFTDCLMELLTNCFFNNPDLWYTINKPEDLQFTLNIKVDWNKDKRLFDILQRKIKKNIGDNYLYPIGTDRRFNDKKNHPHRKDIKKFMEGMNLKSLYYRAYTESDKANKRIKKLRKLSEKNKLIYEKVLKDEMIKFKDNPEKLNKLIDIQKDIDNNYQGLFDGSVLIIWDNDIPRLTTKEFEEEFQYRENTKKQLKIDKELKNKTDKEISKELDGLEQACRILFPMNYIS